MAKRDNFGKHWIIENALDELPNYEAGELTIRGLHYRLVGRGMPNTFNHYKRVVNAMIEARWDGLVEFDAFTDEDRQMFGYTEAEATDVDEEIATAKRQLKSWMRNYNKNRWENQPNYVEVFIEKKALLGLFKKPCEEMEVALGACKGHPSLTFLYEAADRFKGAELRNQNPVILYFGDYDPTGENIPETIVTNLGKMGVDVDLRRILLMKEQVLDWGLPIAPTKKTDTRSKEWDGLGQVELDAVEPRELQRICLGAINDVFDQERYDTLLKVEELERIKYRRELREFVDDELTGDEG